jgi:hypothetical protein
MNDTAVQKESLKATQHCLNTPITHTGVWKTTPLSQEHPTTWHVASRTERKWCKPGTLQVSAANFGIYLPRYTLTKSNYPGE